MLLRKWLSQTKLTTLHEILLTPEYESTETQAQKRKRLQTTLVANCLLSGIFTEGLRLLFQHIKNICVYECERSECRMQYLTILRTYFPLSMCTKSESESKHTIYS